jgi:hypothetical protein
LSHAASPDGKQLAVAQRYDRCKELVQQKAKLMLLIVLAVFSVLVIREMVPMEPRKKLREERRSQILESTENLL